MEREIMIVKTTETELGWEFEVNVDNLDYIVTVTHDYYYKLTAGKITPAQLVENSFEFLMSREPAGSILPEFDLKDINIHFPEYEDQITLK
jgi:hypothetical protein